MGDADETRILPPLAWVANLAIVVGRVAIAVLAATSAVLGIFKRVVARAMRHTRPMEHVGRDNDYTECPPKFGSCCSAFGL